MRWHVWVVPDRTAGAGQAWRVGNVPLPEAHLVGIALGVALHRRHALRLPHAAHVPPWAGPLLIAAGGSVVARSVTSAAVVNLEQPTRLVTTGPYAITRNPMYLGWFLLHLGIGLVAKSGWMLVTLPAATMWVHHGVLAEERVLSRVFGDEFERYQVAVPRYLRVPGRGDENVRSG